MHTLLSTVCIRYWLPYAYANGYRTNTQLCPCHMHMLTWSGTVCIRYCVPYAYATLPMPACSCRYAHAALYRTSTQFCPCPPPSDCLRVLCYTTHEQGKAHTPLRRVGDRRCTRFEPAPHACRAHAVHSTQSNASHCRWGSHSQDNTESDLIIKQPQGCTRKKVPWHPSDARP